MFNMLVRRGDWQLPGESICWRLECALNSTIESWCTEADKTGQPGGPAWNLPFRRTRPRIGSTSSNGLTLTNSASVVVLRIWEFSKNKSLRLFSLGVAGTPGFRQRRQEITSPAAGMPLTSRMKSTSLCRYTECGSCIVFWPDSFEALHRGGLH